MPTTTLSQVPPGVQAFYDRNLLTRAVPADVHGRFGQTRPISTKSGNQIKFRRYNALTPATTPLTEGVTPSGSSLAVTDLTATINQYGDYVTLSDMVDLTNQDPVLTEAGKVLGEQAGTTIDQVRRDVLVAGTNVFYSNGSSRAALNTVLAAGNLDTVIRFLKNQNAKFVREMIKATNGIGTTPIRPAFIGIISPDTEATLEGVPGYKSVSEYSAQMDVMPDECGAYKNIRFVVSTNAKVFTNAGAAIGTDGMISTGGVNNDVYATLIIAANAYGVCPLAGNAMQNIIKALGSAGSADPLDQRATSGWKAATTTKILNDAWMARIEHCNKAAL
jgi:N4-gp56 family major capsid protein